MANPFYGPVRLTRSATGVLALLFAVGCGEDSVGPEVVVPESESSGFSRVNDLRQTLLDSGLGDYLGTVEPVREQRLSAASPWIRQDFDPESGVVCADGSPFFTAYREGSVNKLMLVMDRGGACWNDLSCAIGTAFTEASPPGREGVLSAWTDLATKNWHTVFVPYCDASVFAGDNVVEFPRAGEHIFHGLRNLSAALTVARSKLPEPERVLIVGQSAGAYGSILATGPTRLTFPDADMILFADSGPGVTNVDNELQLSDFRTNWKFTERLPCESCDPQFIRFIGWMLENDDDFSRAGVFSFTEDEVIRQFLGTIGLFSYEALPADVFAGLIRREAGSLKRQFPGRFEYFLAPGTEHMVSREDALFEDTEVDGLTARTWFNGLVRTKSDFRTVDHAEFEP